MKCYKCGAKISQDDDFCGMCGSPIKSIAALVEDGRKGDQQALGELYNRTYEKVYFTLKGLCKDEDTVQDLLQDSYLKAYKNLESLKDPGNFPAWIKMIAINTAKNWFKKKKPILFSQMGDEEEEELDPVAAIVDEYLDHQPEAVMEQQEVKRLLQEILDTLNEKERIAVTLRYYDQWDVKSIAQFQECSEGTIKSRLNYGRIKIEKAVLALEKKGTKLYGLAPIPFFLWLLRGQEVQAAPAAGIIGNVLANLGNETAAETAGSAATQAGTHGATRTAVNAGGHGTAQTAANTGSQAAVHSAAGTAANTAAHTAATAAAKGGTAAVTKGLAAKLVAVAIGGVVIGGGATVGTLTYVEKTEELKQQAEAAMAMQEQSAEEEETWEIRDDLLDNLGENTEETPVKETPTEETPSEPGDSVDMIEATPVPEEETPEATTEPEQKPDVGNAESHEVYEPILAEIRDFMNNGIERIAMDSSGYYTENGNENLQNQYPNVNLEFFLSEADEKVYYAYYDIDRNGRDELIIGIAGHVETEYTGAVNRMDVYTCDGNTPRELFKDKVYLGRSMQSQQRIYSDGTIAAGYYDNLNCYPVTTAKIAEDGFSLQIINAELNISGGEWDDNGPVANQEWKTFVSNNPEVELNWIDLLSGEQKTTEDITQTEPTATPEPTVAPDTVSQANKAARTAYKQIQKEIRLFKGNELQSDDWWSQIDTLKEKYPHMNFTPFSDYNWSPKDHDLFYYYYDIDHNGVDELLLSYCKSDGVMDIYTFDGENAKSIQNEGPALAYRCSNKIFTDGTIYEYGSGGAFAGWAYFYKITDDGYSVTETKNTAVYSTEYASEYGGTDYITQEQLEEMLSQYEEVTNLKWKKLEPISAEAGGSVDESTAPVDVTAEYEAVMVALLKPYAWYLGWQGDDFVFDDYAKSSMIVLATKDAYGGFYGMSYEEVKNACKEPMERYFGPDAEFILADENAESSTGARYMYRNVNGTVAYRYGDSLEFPFGVVDNIQKIGKDTYQMKYDFYIFDGYTQDPPEEYSALVASINQGLSFPANKSYTITLKDTESGFVITDMKLF